MSTSTNGITTLPHELLSKVAFELQGLSRPEDLAALSFVCRKLRPAAQEQILRSVKVADLTGFYNFQGTPFRGTGGRLQTLEKAGKAHLVRNLTISPLDCYLEEMKNSAETRYPSFTFEPSMASHDYPALQHIIDFLIRFPNLDELSLICFPFLSIPSEDYSRLRQPLANVTSLKVVTPPWDRNHDFLSQIVQLTPQLSTLTLQRYFRRVQNRFRPCQTPLPHLPYLSHLILEGQFYFSLPKLNLLTTQQVAGIKKLTVRNFSQAINEAVLPQDYGKKFGTFFAEGVQSLEWQDGWVDVDIPDSVDRQELTSMLNSLVKVRKITTQRLDTENSWLLSVPPSLEVLELDHDADFETMENMVEIFQEYEGYGDGFLKSMRGKTIRLKATEDSMNVRHTDFLWAHLGVLGIKVEFSMMANGEIVAESSST